MIDSKQFIQWLKENGIDFFAGVPDSLLKDFCAYVSDSCPDNHVITANEGAAVALACGYHMATGNLGVVYMQNSGQGNAVNPLASLADREVYSIPLLLLIGWRGEPGKKDEPQHIKQGKITLDLLQAMGIPHKILPDDEASACQTVQQIIHECKQQSVPMALVIKKGTFQPYQLVNEWASGYTLKREEAIGIIADCLDDQDIVVSTTGKTSRELYEHRDKKDGVHCRDFLTVGSMGHSSQIALGISIAKPNRRVFCLDGDGSVIMHMGAMPIIGSRQCRNFRHIVLNNGAHDSVGGQPTVGLDISLVDIAKACGYQSAESFESAQELLKGLQQFKKSPGPSFLEVKIAKGARDDLGRPKIPPQENKKDFMGFLQT